MFRKLNVSINPSFKKTNEKKESTKFEVYVGNLGFFLMLSRINVWEKCDHLVVISRLISCE